jgi:hypothetical protein
VIVSRHHPSFSADFLVRRDILTKNLVSSLAAHASQIVLNVPVKKTMIPLNVTHTAIVTGELHSRLLDPAFSASSGSSTLLPSPSTPLRHTLSTLISYFAASYKSTFGFNDGPPLHDALTVAYISKPDLFKSTRHRVDIELTGAHTMGETVVDVWKYRACDASWGRHGRNCIVAEELNVRNPSNPSSLKVDFFHPLDFEWCCFSFSVVLGHRSLPVLTLSTFFSV